MEIALATGRLYHYTKPVADLLGFPVHYICTDGGFILPAGAQEPILSSFSPDDISKILEILRDYRHGTYLLTPDEIRCFADQEINVQILGWGKKTVSRQYYPGEKIIAQQVVCLIKTAAAGYAYELLQKASLRVQAELTSSLDPEYRQITIRPEGVNKGSGLKLLARILGIAPKATVAFGDWLNDLPMLEEAGLSIVPAGSVPEVQKAADIVSEFSNDQEFIGKELEKLLTEKKISA